jgi:Cu2+-exporting ATPase
LNVGIVDGFLVTGLLATGNVLLAILTVWTLMISERILVETEGDSHEKLINLFGEQPQVVWVQKDEAGTLPSEMEVEIPFDALQIGDIVVVHAGETVP